MAAHSRPSDGVASRAYVLAIHVFDARDERGHDDGEIRDFVA